MDRGIVDIHDFGISMDPKRFTLYTGDDFVFEGTPVLPLHVAGTAAELLKNMTGENAMEKILTFFDEILLPASAAKMREYADPANKTKPLGIEHLRKVIPWLLERYGLRPTQPSSNSSTPSADGDSTSSTAGVSPEASTSSNSD